MSLGFDPFIQQTVQYRSVRVANSTSHASLQVVQDWSDANRQPSNPDLGNDFPPSFGMIAAMESPILEFGQNAAPKLSDIVPSCPTGNCTWPTHVSLGVCARAVDVSASVKINVIKNDPDLGIVFNASLPSHIQDANLTVASAFDYGDVFSMYTASFPTTYLSANGFSSNYQINGENSIALPEIVNPLAHGWILWQAGNPTIPMGGWTNPNARAIEYALEWCAQTYQAIVQDGNASVRLAAPGSLISYSGFEAKQRSDQNLVARVLRPQPGVLTPDLTVDYKSHFGLIDWLHNLQGTVKQSYRHGIVYPTAVRDEGSESAADTSLFTSIYEVLKDGDSDPLLGGFTPMLESVALSMTNQ